MADYLEEQRGEIEALQSIYPDEFKLLSEQPLHCFSISVESDNYEEGAEAGAACILKFTYVNNYPDEPPLIEVGSVTNMEERNAEELATYLENMALENVGLAMVYTLVSASQEWLNVKSEEIQKKKDDDLNRQIREAEEAERKRFEGTIVTVETFLTWKAKFEAEMKAMKKQQKDGLTKKLTGRELFETDQSLNESDIKFLQEGEEEIKVDESLFQELEDLDIEDVVVEQE